MRGRLIFPFEVELTPLDTEAQQDAPGGTSTATAGQDPDFHEPVVLPAVTGEGAGTVNRREGPPYRVPAQIEPKEMLRLQMFLNGSSPETDITVVSHFKHLEAAGLVDTEGNATVRIGDRLSAIYDRDGGVVYTVQDPIFLTHSMPAGFGLGRKRNLLFLTFKCRSAGVTP